MLDSFYLYKTAYYINKTTTDYKPTSNLPTTLVDPHTQGIIHPMFKTIITHAFNLWLVLIFIRLACELTDLILWVYS